MKYAIGNSSFKIPATLWYGRLRFFGVSYRNRSAYPLSVLVGDGSMDLADDPWTTRNLENRNFTYVCAYVMRSENWPAVSLAPIPTACEHSFHIIWSLSEKNSQEECILEHTKLCARKNITSNSVTARISKLVPAERVRKYNIIMKVMVLSDRSWCLISWFEFTNGLKERAVRDVSITKDCRLLRNVSKYATLPASYFRRQ